MQFLTILAITIALGVDSQCRGLLLKDFFVLLSLGSVFFIMCIGFAYIFLKKVNNGFYRTLKKEILLR